MSKSRSRPIKHKRLFALALVSFLYLVWILYAHSRRIQSETISAWTESTNADCAIVLTGGAGRIREGVALLQRNQIRTLIISGVNPATVLSDLLTPWEMVWGVPEERIVLEKNARTTFGNAAQSLPLVEALRCRDVLIVTSQLHIHRAYNTFKAMFPPDIQLRKFAIPAARSEAGQMGFWTEVVKSVFYSIWAY